MKGRLSCCRVGARQARESYGRPVFAPTPGWAGLAGEQAAPTTGPRRADPAGQAGRAAGGRDAGEAVPDRRPGRVGQDHAAGAVVPGRRGVPAGSPGCHWMRATTTRSGSGSTSSRRSGWSRPASGRRRSACSRALARPTSRSAWPPGSPRPRSSARPWTGRRCTTGDWGWSGSGSGYGPGRRRASWPSSAATRPPAPPWPTLRTARRELAVGLGVVAAVTATFNIAFVFLPSHLASTGRAPLSRALAAALIGLLVAAGAAPLAGRVSDRIGRRPLLLAG